MLQLKQLCNFQELNDVTTKETVINFLHTHLERFGDSKEDIGKAIDYSLSTEPGKGGFVLVAYDSNEMVGALVMNNTGMEGYIPENILVYVAVDGTKRGKGYGAQIVNKAIELAKGNVALHVEYDNPAKRLYERLGFESKYAEMRHKKEK